MKKSAAVKLLNKIQENRVETLLKHAYELGAATQATLQGANADQAVSFAKVASERVVKRANQLAQRKAILANKLLSLLH